MRTTAEMSAGEVIAEHRGEMSQSELARRAGISQPFVNQLEHGRRRLTVGTAYKLAIALGIEPRELTRYAADHTDSLGASGGWFTWGLEAA